MASNGFSSDVVVIGGGIVGLAVAREIKVQHSDLTVAVIDKETTASEHSSGRNSGVLHAGFYYSPDSLKALLTVRGNQLLREFASEQGVAIRECGKVVVTRSAAELPALHELARRSDVNGAGAELISETDLSAIEPKAKTVSEALWSPRTAVADPSEVTNAVRSDAERKGVVLHYDTAVTALHNGRVETTRGTFAAGHVINCAGLQADRFAHQLGFGKRYRILPFTGLYTYAPALTGFLKTHVYPVPDPANPFLGVHATITVNGDVKIGPTAIPALSREAYRPIRDVRARDASEIARTLPRFAVSRHHKTWELLKSEIPKYRTASLVRGAQQLVPELPAGAFTKKGRPGIRAQLFDLRERRLVMDFVVEGDEHSSHILNAVSPGWTTSLSFAQHVVENHISLR